MTFSKGEELRLIELVKNKNSQLFGTGLVANGAAQRKKAWEEITTTLNSESGNAKRTVSQVKKKWYNLKSSAKIRNAEIKKNRQGTGGGPSAGSLTNTEAAIVEFVGNTPSFCGLEGFESSTRTPTDDSVMQEISNFDIENEGTVSQFFFCLL